MKAPEKELSELHGVLAQVMKAQLSEQITMTDENGDENVVFTATPALLAQVSKFLKDNNITTSVEEDDNLSALEDMLNKRKEARGARLKVVGEDE